VDTVTWRFGAAAALGLANSRHGPGAHYRRRAHPDEPAHDHLLDPADASAFLDSHHVPAPDALPTADQLARLRAIRDLARALAEPADWDGTSWQQALDEALAEARFRLRADGTMRSVAPGWDGVADDLLPAVRTLAADRERLRTCGNPLCRWLFVDRSRNGSRVWCEMAVCGNRMKVGRHRGSRAARLLEERTPSAPIAS
jgi:predicted RNA-binding Zn ribbon-like protein